MSYKTPEELKYTKEHEWVNIQGDTAVIGITDFAQSSLGDIVFVELPELGTELAQNDAFGVVESIKSVSDLYSPISGTVIEINSELSDGPEKCNQNAYEAWIVKVKLSNPSELENLLTANQYAEHCASAE